MDKRVKALYWFMLTPASINFPSDILKLLLNLPTVHGWDDELIEALVMELNNGQES